MITNVHGKQKSVVFVSINQQIIFGRIFTYQVNKKLVDFNFKTLQYSSALWRKSIIGKYFRILNTKETFEHVC